MSGMSTSAADPIRTICKAHRERGHDSQILERFLNPLESFLKRTQGLAGARLSRDSRKFRRIRRVPALFFLFV
jgi:hypothetical protein